MKLSRIFLLVLAAALCTAGLLLDWKAFLCGAAGGGTCMAVFLLVMFLDEPGSEKMP